MPRRPRAPEPINPAELSDRAESVFLDGVVMSLDAGRVMSRVLLYEIEMELKSERVVRKVSSRRKWPDDATMILSTARAMEPYRQFGLLVELISCRIELGKGQPVG